MLRKYGKQILRIGIGITFLWIGILIVQNPAAWGGYIQPWALKLIPVPVAQLMLGTGILDIILGVLLILNILTWLAGLVAAAHLAVVLVTSGINAITVRDIGLLAAAISITLTSWPRE